LNEVDLIALQYNNEEDETSQPQNNDNAGITREGIDITSNFAEMASLYKHDCVRTLFLLGENHCV
jgi:hypothetical protein